MFRNLVAWIWRMLGGTIPVVRADSLENDGSVDFSDAVYLDDDDDTQ